MELFRRYSVSTAKWKRSVDSLHSKVNALNVTELFTLKWFRQARCCWCRAASTWEVEAQGS